MEFHVKYAVIKDLATVRCTQSGVIQWESGTVYQVRTTAKAMEQLRKVLGKLKCSWRKWEGRE